MENATETTSPRYFIDVVADAIEIRTLCGYRGRRIVERVIDADDWNDFMELCGEGASLAFSSSWDFPRDYTSDKGILALIDAIKKEPVEAEED